MRARNVLLRPNKLLEAEHGNRLDTRAQAATDRADQDLETLGAVHRAEVAGGEGAGQSQRLEGRAPGEAAGAVRDAECRVGGHAEDQAPGAALKGIQGGMKLTLLGRGSRADQFPALCVQKKCHWIVALVPALGLVVIDYRLRLQ